MEDKEVGDFVIYKALAVMLCNTINRKGNKNDKAILDIPYKRGPVMEVL